MPRRVESDHHITYEFNRGKRTSDDGKKGWSVGRIGVRYSVWYSVFCERACLPACLGTQNEYNTIQYSAPHTFSFSEERRGNFRPGHGPQTGLPGGCTTYMPGGDHCQDRLCDDHLIMQVETLNVEEFSRTSYVHTLAQAGWNVHLLSHRFSLTRTVLCLPGLLYRETAETDRWKSWFSPRFPHE